MLATMSRSHGSPFYGHNNVDGIDHVGIFSFSSLALSLAGSPDGPCLSKKEQTKMPMSQNAIHHFTFIVRAEMFRERNTHQNHSVMSALKLEIDSQFRTTGLRKRLRAGFLPTAPHACHAKMFLDAATTIDEKTISVLEQCTAESRNSGHFLLGMIYVACSTRIRNGSMNPI